MKKVMAAIGLVLVLGGCHTDDRFLFDCMEDEDWVVVDHRTEGAVEDPHGVSRLCVHYDG